MTKKRNISYREKNWGEKREREREKMKTACNL